MKAVVFAGTRSVEVREVPDAVLEEPSDVVIRMTSSASKGVSVGFGRTHDRRSTVLLRDMVLSGRARPAAIVTHHGRLDDAPALYQAFDQRADGVIKAVLNP
jgi:glutathione-independent formaldehyde dehydrogenase